MENIQKIQKGAIVKLKSGGPRMTVETYYWNGITNRYEEDKVVCTWFYGDELRRDTFDVATLVKFSE
jgi:uncharacterized protein YodC (DUF2158 family)